MSLSKYEPASFLNKMQADLDDYYKLNGRRMTPSLFEHPVSPFSTDWLPRVNLKESKKAYTISVDVPGVDPKDIEVSMDDGCLVISGERRDEKVEQDENHHLEECFHGIFERRFRMPETAGHQKDLSQGETRRLEDCDWQDKDEGIEAESYRNQILLEGREGLQASALGFRSNCLHPPNSSVIMVR